MNSVTLLTLAFTAISLGLIIDIVMQFKKLTRMNKSTIINIYNCCCPEKKFKFGWHVKELTIFPNLKTKGTILMTTVKVNQSFTATWGNPKDKYGNDAQVQAGSVAFVSDDESIATVEPNPDGGPYSAKITTTTKAGATAIRIQADANLNDDGDPTTGDDVKTIEGLLSVESLAGEASTFGEPTVSDATDNP